jgi:O-antigen ligase
LAGLAICAAPGSIAVSETLLGSALLLRLWNVGRQRARWNVPRVFRFWAVLAALEVGSWLLSPNRKDGWGEMRHLSLIAALFLMASCFGSARDRVQIWRGAVAVATLSSAVLIIQFVYRLLFYRGGEDATVYLRSGGLLHHWMVYSVVEIVVFAGLIELRHFYPGERWWLHPALAIHSLAILLSLTRMLWICCLLVLALHLIWVHSRRLWAVPLIPVVGFLMLPAAGRLRVEDFVRPDYYSNAERVQMLRVGLRMIVEKPWTGIGPGRVDELYTQYLSPGDPVPAYHGHLHNNAVQLAAEFGLPVLGAALWVLLALFRELRQRYIQASGREEVFLCRTALIGLTGFVVSGLFDYTYGHSLGLILLGFAVLAPLSIQGWGRLKPAAGRIACPTSECEAN